MSAKKLWDIQPAKAGKQASAGKKPARTPAKPSAGGMPLRARRKRARNRFVLILTLAIAVVIGLVLYGLHRPEVRVTRVIASGAHEDAIPKVALASLDGTLWGVLPRDSIFFYPEDSVRAAVLEEFPDISALSISRSGFSSIEVSAIARAVAFSWCGAMLGDGLATCYEADGEGFVYAENPNPTGLKIYAPLKEGITEPIGSTVEAVSNVPLALQFVRAIESLGAPVESLQLRGDEADLFVRGSNTRVTYILGEEIKAAGLAATVLPTLSLTDGSIEYLDLRFEGKVYVKKMSAPEEETPIE